MISEPRSVRGAALARSTPGHLGIGRASWASRMPLRCPHSASMRQSPGFTPATGGQCGSPAANCRARVRTVRVPPSGIDWIAFVKRLMKTCFMVVQIEAAAAADPRQVTHQAMGWPRVRFGTSAGIGRDRAQVQVFPLDCRGALNSGSPRMMRPLFAPRGHLVQHPARLVAFTRGWPR